MTNDFKTGDQMLDTRETRFMEQHKLFSPEGQAAAWRIEVQLHGRCPQCQKRGKLRHENHAWDCWDCGLEFTEERFLELFPSPFGKPDNPENLKEIRIIDKENTL